MKNYVWLFTAIFLAMVSPLSAQKALDKASDVSCKCIEEKFDKTKEVSVNEAAVNACIQEAFISNIDAFTEEYGMEVISDQKKAYKIGEELGLLIAKTCPTFIEFSMQLAEKNGMLDSAADEELSENREISGKLVRVENNEFTHLILQNSGGRETDLIWLRYFEGSDALKGKIENLKGKTILVSYVETEVYLPRMQDYFKVKEIIGLEVLD